MKSKQKAACNLQPILANAVYPRPLFMEHLGIGEAAFRTMLANGLPASKIAGRTFIVGKSFLEWFGAREQTSIAETAT